MVGLVIGLVTPATLQGVLAAATLRRFVAATAATLRIFQWVLIAEFNVLFCFWHFVNFLISVSVCVSVFAFFCFRRIHLGLLLSLVMPKKMKPVEVNTIDGMRGVSR
jgi:hypothetical protein